MSRLITISVIVALILALSITGIFYVKDVKADFDRMIAESHGFCENEEQTELLNEARKMSDLWRQKEGFLSFYVRHDEIEKVSTYLVNLESLGENKDFKEALVTLDELTFMMEHIYSREIPNLNNIF